MSLGAAVRSNATARGVSWPVLHPPGGWLLTIALTAFALAPLAYPGFFQAYSGFLPVFNVQHLSDAPNWGMPSGRAGPAPGEGKLPYLLAWPALKLSGSGIEAIKWGYGLAFVLAAMGTYAWTRRWLAAQGGVLAAVVYTYLPWHLSAVYVRGAYGEAWLWAIAPFILWAVDRWSEGRLLAALVVGLTGVLASFWVQWDLAIFLLLLTFLYGCLALSRQRIEAAMGGVAVVVASAWLMAWTVPESQASFSEQFLYPSQLIVAAWSAATSTPLGQVNPPGGFEGWSFQLGFAAIGLTIVALALLVRERSTLQPGFARVLAFWGLASVVLASLTLPLSAPVWRLTAFDALLAHPWRLLALLGLPLAFLAGSVVRLDSALASLPSWAGLVGFAVLASYSFLAPEFTQVDPGPEPVAMLQPVEASAPQIMLLDHDIVSPTEITPTLSLTMTWQTVGPVAGDYTVFVHVLAPDGSKVSQRDTRPCDEECPTDSWRPGEIVMDRHELSLPSGLPARPLRLAVGLYLLKTNERAVVVGRDDATVMLDVP